MNVELWNPKSVCNKNNTKYNIHVLTMVDQVTGWFELSQLKGKPNAFACMKRFDSTWLARFPRPRKVEFNNGGNLWLSFLTCATILINSISMIWMMICLNFFSSSGLFNLM